MYKHICNKNKRVVFSRKKFLKTIKNNVRSDKIVGVNRSVHNKPVEIISNVGDARMNNGQQLKNKKIMTKTRMHRYTVKSNRF